MVARERLSQSRCICAWATTGVSTAAEPTSPAPKSAAKAAFFVVFESFSIFESPIGGDASASPNLHLHLHDSTDGRQGSCPCFLCAFLRFFSPPLKAT